MDALMMPVFSPETVISTAFVQMKEQQRSAIVVGERDAMWIIKAVDLLLARNTRATRLSQIRTRHTVRSLTSEDVATNRLELVDPRLTWENYETLFTKIEGDYLRFGLALSSQGTKQKTGLLGLTVIITSHETIRMELSSPSDCYCTGKRQHTFPRPTAQDGSPCPTGDGATVVCE